MSLFLRTCLPWLLLLIVISLLHISDVYTAFRLPLDAFTLDKLYTLLTAHWVHINLNHYTHNALALIIIMLIVGRALSWRGWLLSFVLSSLTISLMLLALPHDISNYAGLSGLLHGLFMTGCLGMLRQSRMLALILLVLLAGKLAAEILLDVRLLHETGFAVVTRAHLYGVLGGLLSAALIRLTRKDTQQ